MSKTWFLKQTGGNKIGPMTWEELKGFVYEGKIKPEDLVYHDGMDDWTRADSVADLILAKPAGLNSQDGRIKNYIKVACLVAGAITIAWVAAFIITVTLLANSLVYHQAMEKLNNNNEAIELLGRPIIRNGLVRGDGKLSGGNERLSISIPVAGTLLSGKLDAAGVIVAYEWKLTSLVLTVEDGSIFNLIGPLSEKHSPEEETIAAGAQPDGPEWSNRLEVTEQGFSFAYPAGMEPMYAEEENLNYVSGSADSDGGLIMIIAANLEGEEYYDETEPYASVEEMLEEIMGYLVLGYQISDESTTIINQATRTLTIDGASYSAIELVTATDALFLHTYLVGIDTDKSFYTVMFFDRNIYNPSNVFTFYERQFFDSVEFFN